MLKISGELLREIEKIFLHGDREQGFMLGCTARLDELNRYCQIPAVQAGKYFYSPDPEKANMEIQNWCRQGVCFCGFVHSHLVNRCELSDEDIQFAYRIFDSYSIPVLWFGIGVVGNGKVEFFFYSVSKFNGEKRISPVCYMRF